MTPSERDLDAVERGELPREEFLTRHGDEGAKVLAAHELMLAAASADVVDLSVAWAAFRGRLEEAPAVVVRLRRGKRRTAVLALAATLVLGGTAFAAGGRFGDEPDEGQRTASIPTEDSLGGDETQGPIAEADGAQNEEPQGPPEGDDPGGVGTNDDTDDGSADGEAGTNDDTDDGSGDGEDGEDPVDDFDEDADGEDADDEDAEADEGSEGDVSTGPQGEDGDSGAEPEVLEPEGDQQSGSDGGNDQN